MTSTEIQMQYLVVWESSRGKSQWVSQDILSNENLCSSQAKAFLNAYLNRVASEEKKVRQVKMEEAATVIQAEARRYVYQRKFRVFHKGVVLLQLRFRSARGQLHLRRQRLIRKRRLNYMQRMIEDESGLQQQTSITGDIFSILNDARMGVINNGKHLIPDENMWTCEYCDFLNEQTSKACELCLETPSISRKVLQLGKQYIASLTEHDNFQTPTNKNVLASSTSKHKTKKARRNKRHTLV